MNLTSMRSRWVVRQPRGPLAQHPLMKSGLPHPRQDHRCCLPQSSRDIKKLRPILLSQASLVIIGDTVLSSHRPLKELVVSHRIPPLHQDFTGRDADPPHPYPSPAGGEGNPSVVPHLKIPPDLPLRKGGVLQTGGEGGILGPKQSVPIHPLHPLYFLPDLPDQFLRFQHLHVCAEL